MNPLRLYKQRKVYETKNMYANANLIITYIGIRF